MRLVRKVQIGVLAVSVLFGSVVVGEFWYISQLQQSLTRLEKTVALRRKIFNYMIALLDIETGQRGFIIVGDPDYLKTFAAATQSLPTLMAELRRSYADRPDVTPILDRIEMLAALKLARLEETIDLRASGDTAAATARVADGEARTVMNELRGIVSQLLETESDHLRAYNDTVFVQAETITRAVTVGGGLAVALLAFLGLAVVGNLNRRIQSLRKATETLAHGDFSTRYPVSGSDEFAELGVAFNTMAMRLEESNAALDSFAYSVSHDLRAPLRAMEGYARALEEDFGDAVGEDGRHYMARIVSASHTMDGLIDDLLTFSRLSRADLTLTKIDSTSVVRTILSERAKEIETMGAAVTVEDPLPAVIGDRTALKQALDNLISNALKFVRPGAPPRIEVKGETDGDRARILVKDRGIGVPSEHFKRIFNAFERLHGGETYPGTGIGLAIVAKATERMHGQCGVAPRSGGGSSFWIELPRGAINER